VKATLLSRSDGRFTLEDRNSHLAAMQGVNVDMGPCAVVRVEGVTILLTTATRLLFDLGQWRRHGVEPSSLSIIGVKAAVAHRRAYDAIAAARFTGCGLRAVRKRPKHVALSARASADLSARRSPQRAFRRAQPHVDLSATTLGPTPPPREPLRSLVARWSAPATSPGSYGCQIYQATRSMFGGEGGIRTLGSSGTIPTHVVTSRIGPESLGIRAPTTPNIPSCA
jgi:hypothetical protein